MVDLFLITFWFDWMDLNFFFFFFWWSLSLSSGCLAVWLSPFCVYNQRMKNFLWAFFFFFFFCETKTEERDQLTVRQQPLLDAGNSHITNLTYPVLPPPTTDDDWWIMLNGTTSDSWPYHDNNSNHLWLILHDLIGVIKKIKEVGS